jgi:TM2 domain-containing membrane protein YozV
MSDEMNNPWTSTGTPGDTPTNPEPTATDRVGFCQNCGRPLTTATIRNVGTGVFCEPCLTARAGVPNPTPGYATVPPYTAVPPYATVPPVTAVPGAPSPVLAAILGFIPGVGAMYNGQFAKGIVHVAVFAILVSLSDNVNGIFGLFVAGWIFYMAFEAYHTAKARLEGLSLPNAFGLNDIGELMGFGKSWGAVAPVTPVGTPQNPPPTVPPVPGYVASTQASASTAPDWVGYVPPTAFGTAAAQQQAAAAAMAAQIREQALRDSGYYNHAPYAPTYTGPDTQSNPYTVNIPPVEVLVGQRRFPVGAFWLIGLGVLILLANVIPNWEMSSRWWPPILFAGLAGWIFTRRLRSGAKIICIIRWPLVLLVLAIMLALHAANVAVTFGLTCAVLLILFGGLLLLERTVGASPSYAAPVAATGYTSVVPPSEPVDAQPRATWSETDTPKEDHTA